MYVFLAYYSHPYTQNNLCVDKIVFYSTISSSVFSSKLEEKTFKVSYIILFFSFISSHIQMNENSLFSYLIFFPPIISSNK